MAGKEVSFRGLECSLKRGEFCRLSVAVEEVSFPGLEWSLNGQVVVVVKHVSDRNTGDALSGHYTSKLQYMQSGC